jgi:hypothetical protein
MRRGLASAPVHCEQIVRLSGSGNECEDPGCRGARWRWSAMRCRPSSQSWSRAFPWWNPLCLLLPRPTAWRPQERRLLRPQISTRTG